MYKPLIIFNESLKDRPGLKSLKKEGWDIYNILSKYDPITFKAFAEEAEKLNVDGLGIIVENINDPIIDNIYENAGNTKVEIIEASRLYEAGAQADAATTDNTQFGGVKQTIDNTPIDPQSSSVTSDIRFPATKDHVSFCFALHMQQYTNLDKIKDIFNKLGKKTASNGILDQIQRENHNVDISKGDLGPVIGAIGTVQYAGKGRDKYAYEVKADNTGHLTAVAIDANTRRETSLIDPTILTIQQSEYMAQGLTNNAYINMVNAYCGAGTITGVTSGNNSLISDLVLESTASFAVSDNPINKVSRKREAFVTFIYFMDPSSILRANFTGKDDENKAVYFFNKNTQTPGLTHIAAYIESVCAKHQFKLDNEVTIKKNNERIKNIVLRIRDEMIAGHKAHAYYDRSKSQDAAAIWNAAGIFASNCIWLSNINFSSNAAMSDEDAAEAADEAERQNRINKLKSKNAKNDFIHDWATAWGKMSSDYQALANVTANSTNNGKYDDAIAEEEYYAELAKTNKAKIDNKLTAAFVCAPSFEDFASIMFPTWNIVKTIAYTDKNPLDRGTTKETDKTQNNTQDNAENKKQSNSNQQNTGLKSTNIEVDPEDSKDSLFQNDKKEDNSSLF